MRWCRRVIFLGVQAPQGLALRTLPQPPGPGFVLSHLSWRACQKRGTRPTTLGDPRLHPRLLLHMRNSPDDLPSTSFILPFFPPGGSSLRCILAGTQVSQLPQQFQGSHRRLRGLPASASRGSPAPTLSLAGSPGPAPRGSCGGRGTPGARPDEPAT